MYPDALLERYRAVLALAERGAPGERDNARRIVAKMEQDNPGIRSAAFPPPPPPETTEWWESGKARQPNTSSANPFTRWREAASGAFSWVSEVASEIIATNQARSYADAIVDMQVKWLPSGKWQLALRLSHNDLAEAQNMTPFQKTEFIRHVLANVERELNEVLAEY
jgi:hypothetical protein